MHMERSPELWAVYPHIWRGPPCAGRYKSMHMEMCPCHGWHGCVVMGHMPRSYGRHGSNAWSDATRAMGGMGPMHRSDATGGGRYGPMHMEQSALHGDVHWSDALAFMAWVQCIGSDATRAMGGMGPMHMERCHGSYGR